MCDWSNCLHAKSTLKETALWKHRVFSFCAKNAPPYMEQIELKEDSEMEFYVILLIFALGLLVVGAAFVNGAKFVLGMIGRIVDCIFGRHGD